jgi:hypothetical protein
MMRLLLRASGCGTNEPAEADVIKCGAKVTRFLTAKTFINCSKAFEIMGEINEPAYDQSGFSSPT